jgi:hypothetical protein
MKETIATNPCLKPVRQVTRPNMGGEARELGSAPCTRGVVGRNMVNALTRYFISGHPPTGNIKTLTHPETTCPSPPLRLQMKVIGFLHSRCSSEHGQLIDMLLYLWPPAHRQTQKRSPIPKTLGHHRLSESSKGIRCFRRLSKRIRCFH